MECDISPMMVGKRKLSMFGCTMALNIMHSNWMSNISTGCGNYLHKSFISDLEM